MDDLGDSEDSLENRTDGILKGRTDGIMEEPGDGVVQDVLVGKIVGALVLDHYLEVYRCDY